MTHSRRPASAAKNVHSFIRHLEHQYVSLRAVGAAEQVLTHYSELLAHLKSRSTDEQEAIFPSSKRRPPQAPRQGGLSDRDEAIQQWPIERVEALLANDEVSRGDLERVARVRFGLTRGAISSLKNKEALKEKIQTVVRNERGHESIKRLAQAGRSENNDM